MDTQPTAAAMRAATEIVRIVNLDGVHKLNVNAKICIARIIDHYADELAAEHGLTGLPASIQEALNSGDGTYRP